MAAWLQGQQFSWLKAAARAVKPLRVPLRHSVFWPEPVWNAAVKPAKSFTSPGMPPPAWMPHSLGAEFGVRGTRVYGGGEPVAQGLERVLAHRAAVAVQALEQRLGHCHQRFGVLQVVAVEHGEHVDLDHGAAVRMAQPAGIAAQLVVLPLPMWPKNSTCFSVGAKKSVLARSQPNFRARRVKVFSLPRAAWVST
jgi:hypothetical protein